MLVLAGVGFASDALSAADGGGGVELTGVVSRSEVEQMLPEWVSETVDARPDVDVAMALGEVRSGARVTVFFGTWCLDSRRELARLWKALDQTAEEASFAVDYVAIDRDKREPAELLAGREILYVPTFVVERDGEEIGRIVEQPKVSIESDLLALLDGSASGSLSARDDLPRSVHAVSR